VFVRAAEVVRHHHLQHLLRGHCHARSLPCTYVWSKVQRRCARTTNDRRMSEGVDVDVDVEGEMPHHTPHHTMMRTEMTGHPKRMWTAVQTLGMQR
jgi:hypothetical protein